MASSLNNPQANSRFQSAFSCEHNPKMLKDFLKDDSYSSNPCKASPVLLRSRSRKAAETTISAIHKVINVVKFFPFSSVKSPLVLPRFVSRKLSMRSRNRSENFQEVSVTVKVKDILRWRSFRDLVEEKSPRCTTTTAASAATTEFASTTTSRHDFTEEILPFRCSEHSVFLYKNGVEIDENCLPKETVGQPTNDTSGTTRNLKGELSFEESEQHSPVSVLDSLFQEEDESTSPFHHQSFANIERRRCRLMQRIQEFSSLFEGEKLVFDQDEEVEINAAEEKAKQLLGHVKAIGSAKNYDSHLDHILLDFFRFELATKGNFDDFELDCDLLRQAKSWINGEYNESFEWEMRENYVNDMERGLMWKNKFKEEQEELAMDLEIEVLRDLFGEFLDDFIT
ncbi:hypothetical protein Fot_47825 [Forsythia ovata]|uniref:DUF4378 domain-containing protein n=1 Tax=Forsythia ovata TaxID=205694 RepID=A0ABD1QUE2_9LAMI